MLPTSPINRVYFSTKVLQESRGYAAILVGKDKRKRRALLTPDISRITPYSPQVCVARLQQFSDKHARMAFEAQQDGYDSETWHFTIRKTFINPESGRGRTRVQLHGTLMKWGPNAYTRVRAIAQAARSEHLQIAAVFVTFVVILLLPRALPPTAQLLVNALMIVLAAYFVFSKLSSIRRFKAEFINEIKVVLHKEGGSFD